MARLNDAVAAMSQEFADLLVFSGVGRVQGASEKAARGGRGVPAHVDDMRLAGPTARRGWAAPDEVINTEAPRDLLAGTSLPRVRGVG